MRYKELIKIAEKFTIDNSPTILSGAGIIGTVTTAYLTGKASFTAADIIAGAQHQENLQELGHPLTTKEKTKLVWKEYISPVASGTVTVTAIFYANRIGVRRAAALASAYAISEKAYSEYKDKVVEKLGIKKEQEARDELAQDRVNRNPVNGERVIITGNGEVLCYDHFTGRYFKSSMETLKKAQNDTNYQILNRDFASLSDFYERIELPATSFSEEVGWNHGKKLELVFSTTLSQDGQPCIAIDFDIAPIRDYSKCWAD